jgi:hypothetical protein
VYGIDCEGQIEKARKVRKVFESTFDIVDVDDSVEYPSDKLVLVVDRAKAARLGVAQSAVAEALGTVLKGEDMSFLHGANVKYAVPIRVEYRDADKADIEQVLALRVRSMSGQLVPLSEIVKVDNTTREHSIHHKDLLPVVYVTGDMAGKIDSPLYGMFEISSALKALPGLEQWFIQQPPSPYEYSVKWDGEWQVTYETFRDMGIAYGVGLILIYLLVVAQFRSYLVPPGDHGADPAHHHRHPAGARPAGGSVHRDLDDRHDRLGRDHRAQLHSLGRLHQPGGPPRDALRAGRDPLGRGPRQADRPDRRRGHGGGGLHPGRPDLFGARGLAPVRYLRLHYPDPGGHPGGLLRRDAQAGGVESDGERLRGD